MNVLDGKIASFSEFEGISLVDVLTKRGNFSVLMLNFSASLNAKIGSKVQVLFKENELFLAKKGAKVLCENVFETRISSIKRGEILSEICLENEFRAMLGTKILNSLNLCENEEILCFVKPSAVIIKVLN